MYFFFFIYFPQYFFSDFLDFIFVFCSFSFIFFTPDFRNRLSHPSSFKRPQRNSSLCSRAVFSSLSSSFREMENAARKALGEMAALCVPNLCRAVLRAPLRGTISQEWLSPFYSPGYTRATTLSLIPDPPLPFSPARKIIATALRITRSYLRPVRL